MAFSSFSRQGGHPPPLAEINTTPLVDVMLVLLLMVFAMVFSFRFADMRKLALQS